MSDDKKLSGVLKKMALTDIKGVEEVNIFKNDDGVINDQPCRQNQCQQCQKID